MARTYYHTGIDEPTGVHNATIEKLADTTAPSPQTFTIGGIGMNGRLVAAFTSPTNEPDSAAWPTADYTATIDVFAMDSTITYGFRLQGTVTGHIARVDAALTTDLETHEQASPAFSTPGVKTVLFAAQSWVAGLQTDRVEVLLAAVKVFGHGTDEITIAVDGDGKIAGPWVGAGAAPIGMLSFDAEVVSAPLAFDADVDSLLGFDAEIV